jgi:hypothetical protein
VGQGFESLQARQFPFRNFLQEDGKLPFSPFVAQVQFR